MREKFYYDGLFGEDSIDLVRDVIYVSAINQKYQYNKGFIKPHAHSNLFQIFLFETGSATFTVNDNSFEVKAKSFITVPKNVLHGLQMKPETTGWLITLSDIALERMLTLDTNIIFAIDEILICEINMKNALIENLYVTMHKCIAEFNNQLPAREFALEYLVGMLLIRLYRIPRQDLKSVDIKDHVYNIYYRNFLHLVKENHHFNTPVQSYAESLKISTGHLNRICHEVSEKSPKQLIHDYFISESRRYLGDIKKTVAQISYELGFEDPNYFTRFFRQKTGLSPSAYRRSIGAH